MATFSRIKTWVSNEVLTAADLNSEFDNIINNITPSGIEDASANIAAMQASVDPGGVGTESLATTLLGEIQRLRFVVKRIVGGAQWYVAPVINLAQKIGSDQLADDAVITAKIPNLAVTRAKLVAVGQQISSSSGSFTTTSTTAVDVTNLTATIVTTGRPVRIALIHDGSSFFNKVYSEGYGYLDCLRGSTSLGVYNTRGPASPNFDFLPASAFEWFDTPAAGTYTYKIQCNRDNLAGTNMNVWYTKLLVYEL